MGNWGLVHRHGAVWAWLVLELDLRWWHTVATEFDQTSLALPNKMTTVIPCIRMILRPQRILILILGQRLILILNSFMRVTRI